MRVSRIHLFVWNAEIIFQIFQPRVSVNNPANKRKAGHVTRHTRPIGLRSSAGTASTEQDAKWYVIFLLPQHNIMKRAARDTLLNPNNSSV
jgi:hypothetical protein